MILADNVKEDVSKHAEAEFPREACGLVIVFKGKQRYIACRNLAVGTDQFAIHPEDYAASEDLGEIVAVVHSHPNIPAAPSQPDLVACEASGLPWFILSHPVGVWSETYPSGYKAPLVGRQWAHGVLDCYSIIRDWFENERGIFLPDFERHDEWWLRGENLYEENFAKAGFRQIERDELRTGDVILMQVGSPVSNHGAIYLGDGLILHHVQNRLSTRDVYGGYWLKNTTKFLRYEDNNSAG